MTRDLKKLSFESKVAALILIIFLIWSFIWNFFKLFKPMPLGDFRNELLSFGHGALGLGTDLYGRDLFFVMSEGLSYSLGLAIIVSLSSLFIGVIVGHILSLGGSIRRRLMSGLTDSIFIVPNILIAILMMGILGQSFWGLVFVLSLTGWPSYAKIAFGEFERFKNREFIEAAKSIGSKETRLVFWHFLPNILPVMGIQFVLGISSVIITESTLGFLGLGGSEYSWGALLSMGKTVLLESPRVTVVVSFVLALLIVSLNILADELRDRFDPQAIKVKKHGP